MDPYAPYHATLLEMTAHGVTAAGRRLHTESGDRLGGAWRSAAGDRAGNYRYEACCAQMSAGKTITQDPPYPRLLVDGPDGVASVVLQLWDQRVWWDTSGLYLEARWRPGSGEQPYSLHGLGAEVALPREQRVREALSMLTAIQRGEPGPTLSEEAPNSPYWRLIDPILDQQRKGRTVEQIAVYLGVNPIAVRRYVGVHDRLHANDTT